MQIRSVSYSPCDSFIWEEKKGQKQLSEFTLFSTLKVFLCGVLHGVTSCNAAQAALQHRWNSVYVPSFILGLSLKVLMAALPSLDLYANFWLWFYTRKQESVSCMCSVINTVASMRKTRLENQKVH